LFAFLTFLMHATYPAHLILVYLIAVVVSGEAYKLWSSSFCSLLHSSVTSSLLGPYILFSTLWSSGHSVWQKTSLGWTSVPADIPAHIFT
jgi:hypothetical protein